MAIIKKADIAGKVTKKLDMSTPLPKASYTLLCQKQEYGISKSSKNPMVTRVWEIISPETVKLPGTDGAVIQVAGTELTQYLPLAGVAKPDKGITKEQADVNAVDRYLKENEKLGLNSTEVDTENPQGGDATGKTVIAICGSRETSPMDETTGQPIYDPNTGKPVKRYMANLEEILGLAKAQVQQAF